MMDRKKNEPTCQLALLFTRRFRTGQMNLFSWKWVPTSPVNGLIVMQTHIRFQTVSVFCSNKGCHIVAPVWNWKISVSYARRIAWESEGWVDIEGRRETEMEVSVPAIVVRFFASCWLTLWFVNNEFELWSNGSDWDNLLEISVFVIRNWVEAVDSGIFISCE